jgi:hypothetical protein
MTVWYIARGAGLSAVVLLTAATCIGALLGARLPAHPGARVVLQHVHRAVASTALIVLGVHITAILADSYAHVGVVGALVPGQSAYRALWVALGSIAVYLLVAVAATGFLRARMSRSPRWTAAWRGIHGAAYAAWAMAMLHGLRSGTDSGVTWVRWIYVCCAAAVAGCVAVRLLAGGATRSTPASSTPAAHITSDPIPHPVTAGAR